MNKDFKDLVKNWLVVTEGTVCFIILLWRIWFCIQHDESTETVSCLS